MIDLRGALLNKKSHGLSCLVSLGNLLFSIVRVPDLPLCGWVLDTNTNPIRNECPVI